MGHTVVGKAQTADDKGTISDVVEVLLFLKRLLADREGAVATIQILLEDGFHDSQGRNLLAHRLPHLDTSRDKPALARRLHGEIMQHVFNAPVEGGTLVVQIIRGAEGELALKLGEAEPFGVVNVGDRPRHRHLPHRRVEALFGLARYAGLRIPSESHLLTWADVDFEKSRLLVRSPKSIWSAWRSLFSRMRWTLCHTPACFQSRSRRQQVMPEPQPISCGSISQGMPDMRTNRMPVKHARSGSGLRPGLRFLRGRAGM